MAVWFCDGTKVKTLNFRRTPSYLAQDVHMVFLGTHRWQYGSVMGQKLKHLISAAMVLIL